MVENKLLGLWTNVSHLVVLCSGGSYLPHRLRWLDLPSSIIGLRLYCPPSPGPAPVVEVLPYHLLKFQLLLLPVSTSARKKDWNDSRMTPPTTESYTWGTIGWQNLERQNQEHLGQEPGRLPSRWVGKPLAHGTVSWQLSIVFPLGAFSTKESTNLCLCRCGGDPWPLMFRPSKLTGLTTTVKGQKGGICYIRVL